MSKSATSSREAVDGPPAVITRVPVNWMAKRHNDVQIASRFEHPEHLAHRLDRVLYVFEYCITFNTAHGLAGKGQRFYVGHHVNTR